MKKMNFISRIFLLLSIVFTSCSSDDDSDIIPTNPPAQIGKILFAATVENYFDYHLFVIDKDGSNEKQLTNFGSYTGSASWSPDGSKIIFTSDKDIDDGGSSIYIMNSDGSDVTRVNHNLGRKESNPVWK